MIEYLGVKELGWLLHYMLSRLESKCTMKLWNVHMNTGLAIWFPISMFGLLLKVQLSRCPMKTLACTVGSFHLVSYLCVCIAIESPIIQILWAILFALTYFVGEE